MINVKEDLQAIQLQELREQIIDALVKCGGGHFGGALSVIDILWVLYDKILRIDPDNFQSRDRFILSKGHACIAQYAILAKLGYFDVEELSRYGRHKSLLEGHPNMLKTPGIDFSSGSLGQGLSLALGFALGLKKKKADAWVVLGDGECQEGQVWEAAMLASRLKVNNLKAIVDNNKHQEYGWYFEEDVSKLPMDNIESKFISFGWKVLSVDGHDCTALEEIFKEARAYREGPCVVVANTVKGKGYEMIERDPIRFHCGELTSEEAKSMVRPNEVFKF